MKSHIYLYLKFYPFLWSYCDKIVFSYFMCTLPQTLSLSTSLLLGSFRYVFNIIIVLTCIVSICMYYFICGFYVSLLICNYIHIDLKSNQIKSSLLPYFTADCFPSIIQHSQCSTPMFNSSTRRHVFAQSHMCMHMCICTYAYTFMYI